MEIEKVEIEGLVTYRLTNSPYCQIKQRSHYPSIPFDSSWEWLMPVWIKISRMASTKIDNDSALIQVGGDYMESSNCLIDCDFESHKYLPELIDSVYYACQEFIEYYLNKNQ
jgi:hypothetical protein